MRRFLHPRRSAFTLVELLTVIFIISLLIAILVPAISSVRTKAKVVATQAIQSQIGLGLETFKADGKFGGAYPPSRTDQPYTRATPPSWNHVANPFRFGNALNPPFATPEIEITGAGLLVWALSGPDLLGTAGFPSNWSTICHNDQPAGNRAPGLYSVVNNVPSYPRGGQYVDLSKIKVTRWAGRQNTANGAGGFDIEAEVQATGGRPQVREYPMYLDAFGYPILYWRADAVGDLVADNTDANNGGGGGDSIGGAARGVYHYADNRRLIDPDSADSRNTVLTLRKGANRHQLKFDNVNNGNRPANQAFAFGTFQAFINDPRVSAKHQPYRSDSYILLSAGPDGVFGTADDIANFDHNGQ